MTATRGNIYAFERAYVWRVGSNGIATCQLDPDNLTANTTSHAYAISGPIEAQLPRPTFGKAEFKGGMSYEGSADTGLESISTGTMTASQMDDSLDALLQGGLVDTTSLTNATISSTNGLNPSPRQVGLMLVARKQSRLSASAGANKYIHYIYPKCQMRTIDPNLTQASGMNVAPLALEFSPQVTSKFHTGIAFGANQTWQNNSNFMYRITSDKPYALTIFVQNASTTTYTTEFLPTSSAVSSGTTTNWFTVGGAATAPTSIVTTTGVVTLAAAGSSGVVALAFYQSDYVPV